LIVWESTYLLKIDAMMLCNLCLSCNMGICLMANCVGKKYDYSLISLFRCTHEMFITGLLGYDAVSVGEWYESF